MEVTSFSEFFIHPADQALSTAVVDNRNPAAPWGVAPNPVGDLLVLTAPTNLVEENVQADVFAANGRKLTTRALPSGSQRYLDSSNWPSGAYTIVLTSAFSRTSIRVIR